MRSPPFLRLFIGRLFSFPQSAAQHYIRKAGLNVDRAVTEYLRDGRKFEERWGAGEAAECTAHDERRPDDGAADGGLRRAAHARRHWLDAHG